ncbi:MAG: hypothetical protein ABW065_05320 [Solirubrobacterales bacterium]
MRPGKRLLVAAALAVLALAATAAIASASVWKDGGTNVSSAIEIKFAGAEFWETSEGNSMQCEEKFTLKTSGGEKAEITAFEIVKTGCAKTGTLTGCELSTAEPKGLPWAVDVKTEDLLITSMRLKRTFKAGCSISELDKTINSTVTLSSPTAIEEIETFGETGTYKQYGSFEATTNKGTYGIG